MMNILRVKSYLVLLNGRVNRTKVLIRVEKIVNQGRDSQWRTSVTHSVPASWIDTKDLDKLPIVTKVE